MATGFSLQYQAGDYITQEFTYGQDTFPAQIAIADPTRVLLAVCIKQDAGPYYLTTLSTPPALFSGLLIPTDGTALVLRYHDWGPLVGVAWYWTGAVTPGLFTVLTVFTVSYRPTGR